MLQEQFSPEKLLKPDSKILLILHGALGDVVRALPLVTRIKKAYPESHLTWAVEPLSYSLLIKHPAIDRVVLFKRIGGLKAYHEFISELRKYQYDFVLDLQRHFKSGLTSKLAARGAKIIGWNPKNSKEFNWIFSNYTIPKVIEPAPKIITYQLFGDFLGVEQTNSANKLKKLPSLDFGLIQNQQLPFELPSNEKFVALIIGSSWKSRFWFPESYAKIILVLQKKWGYCALIIGGPGEASFAAEIISHLAKLEASEKQFQQTFINLVGKTPLEVLPTLFAKVEFAIGSDSGPMHIAAAVNKPVISLWGSTSPQRSAPFGSEDLVLQSAIGCSPCYLRNCPLKDELGRDRPCMSAITPEAVLAMVENLHKVQ